MESFHRSGDEQVQFFVKRASAQQADGVGEIVLPPSEYSSKLILEPALYAPHKQQFAHQP